MTLYTTPTHQKPMCLRPGSVRNETGSVVLVPSWLEADTVTRYSIPGVMDCTNISTVSANSEYWRTCVLLAQLTVSVRRSGPSSNVRLVRVHLMRAWEDVMSLINGPAGTLGGTAWGIKICQSLAEHYDIIYLFSNTPMNTWKYTDSQVNF